MKRFRRIVFWCHLVTGVTIGLVVLAMAATGVLMAFERQIVEWADMRGLVLDGTPADPLSPDELLAALPDSLGPARSLIWRSGRPDLIAATFGRDQTIFVDARTGTIAGEPNTTIRAFFSSVLGVHRWLAASDDVRGMGRAVTGLANIALLFMIVTGLFLWWPRNWIKAAVRNVVLFRRGLSRKARKFNRHNVLGIWSAFPLIVIAVTGVMLSYPAAGDAVFAAYDRLVADQPESTDDGAVSDAPAEFDTTRDMSLAALRRLAAGRVPDWRTLTLDLARSSDERAVFHIDRGTGGQPRKQADLVLDRRSGAVMDFTPFAHESPGTRFFEMIRYIHTGEAFGPAGQFIAGLVSLAAVFLVWTGVTLAWLRGLRAIGRRRREPT